MPSLLDFYKEQLRKPFDERDTISLYYVNKLLGRFEEVKIRNIERIGERFVHAHTEHGLKEIPIHSFKKAERFGNLVWKK